MDERWVEVSSSEMDWEARALDYLREVLPEQAPYRVWSNAVILDSHAQKLREIDAIVLTRFGLVVLEIKSWKGVLYGDQSVWKQGHRQPVKNPLEETDLKAKVLKGLLEKSRAAAKNKGLPYVSAAIWLSETGSHSSLDVRLSEAGRLHTYAKRGDAVLPSIEEHLLSPDGGHPQARDRVTPAMEATVVAAMKEIGLRPRLRPTVFGSWRLGEELDTAGEYQDFLATHVSLPDEKPRRVRVYPTGATSDPERAEALQRAARREHSLLRGITHPAIPAALEYAETEMGPAVMFGYNPDLTRLDLFVQTALGDMSVAERLALLRALAETVSYAHRRDLTHRALSPRSVWVARTAEGTADGGDGSAEEGAGLGFRVQVLDWVAGAMQSGTLTSRTVTATRHVTELVDESASAYLAPEAVMSAPEQPGMQLDVFSLGAIGYLLLTGHPPASAFGVLMRRLQDQSCLRPSAVVDGVPEPVDRLIAHATAADPAQRAEDVAAFLADLDEAMAAATPAPGPPEEAQAIDPLAAEPGDELEGGFTVLRRLGSGATAVALLVQRGETTCVLKVARTPEQDDRLRAEAGALGALHAQQSHVGVVQLLDGPLETGGRQALVLSLAGERTLADELRQRGRLQPEWLKDWGVDLLDTLAVLEDTGTVHRDIKPSNLGVAERGGKGKKLGLVLYDFSLTDAPLERVELGTTPYLDPFLGRGLRDRWDDAAERYAVAVTLYEMATGAAPAYGSGHAHPAVISDDVRVDADKLDRGYADGLTGFFRTALTREARSRHLSAQQMREAWLAAFAERTTAEATREAALTRESPIGAAGLAGGVLTALERLGVVTVGDALDLAPAQIRWQPGIGTKTRAQVAAARESLAQRVAQGPGRPAAPTEPTALDQAADSLVTDKLDRDVAELMFGLDEEQQLTDGAWASGRDLARALGRSQGKTRRAIHALAGHWLSVAPLAEVKEQAIDIAEQAGGVMAAEDLTAALLDHVGSVTREPLRSRLAAAVLRAAVEAELAGSEEPRLSYLARRDSDRPVLVAAGSDPDRGHGASVAERLAWADALGEEADVLAAHDVLPTAARVEQALRDAASDAGMPADELATLGAERLVRMAVVASQTAAMTPRLEVYPTGMAAERALRLSADALVGAGSLSEEEIAERVRSRFPRAEPLPARPGLDALLAAAEVPLAWEDDSGRYVAPQAAGQVSSITTAGTRTRVGETVYRRLVDEVAALDERLERSLAEGGWLVLTTTGRRLADARRALTAFDVTVVDVERVMLEEMHAFAQAKRIHWETVLAADAAPEGSADRRRLKIVSDAALERVREQVTSAGPAVLLVNAGILARYDRGLSVLESWREQVRTQTGEAGLRTLWLLVPWREVGTAPTLDGVAVPVLGHGQYATLPMEWIHSRRAPVYDPQ